MGDAGEGRGERVRLGNPSADRDTHRQPPNPTASVRTVRLLSTVGVCLLWCLAAGCSFFAFFAAMGVGLSTSAGTGTISEQPAPWIVATLLIASGSALLLYLSLYLRERSLARTRWIVAAVLGALTALGCMAFTLLEGFLLTSATWGSRARSDYAERGRLVEAVLPTWVWWSFLLLAAVIAASVFLARGATANDGEASRQHARYVYATFSLIPIATVGVLLTTSTVVV